MISAREIQVKLEGALPGARVEVVDTTGTSDHFEAIVVAEQFEGLNRVEQHQAVYDALGDAFDVGLHALALKTYTPKRFEKLSKR